MYIELEQSDVLTVTFDDANCAANFIQIRAEHDGFAILRNGKEIYSDNFVQPTKKPE